MRLVLAAAVVIRLRFTARIAEARFLPAAFEKVPFDTEHATHFLLRKR
jgi:hypothetical protein